MAAVFAALITSLAALRPLALLGRRSILHWIDDRTASVLQRLPAQWWITTGLIAVVMSATALHETQSQTPMLMLAGSLLMGLLAASLAALTRIDALCRLLPDPLTGLLIGSGLVARGIGVPPAAVGLVDGLVGCMLGYLLLWCVAFGFKKIRGVDAMGRGDFAMSAGLGAWLGWQSLPMIWLVASLSGIAFVLLGRRQRHIMGHPASEQSHTGGLMGTEIAFGPALALGAVTTWVLLG